MQKKLWFATTRGLQIQQPMELSLLHLIGLQNVSLPSGVSSLSSRWRHPESDNSQEEAPAAGRQAEVELLETWTRGSAEDVWL